MGHNVTIGGDRLGSGAGMKAYLHDYERSTHDLSFTWRSTMSAGTLVPFLTELALPGDTFDIDLNADVLTHPTIGPLFGTYKIQLDVFFAPFRLYQAQLHMNQLGIGMKMANVFLPQLHMSFNGIDFNKPIDNQQINPSCILSYLNIRGGGYDNTNIANQFTRKYCAIPYLAYWEIYKQYYANKSEEVGAVIHRDPLQTVNNVLTATIQDALPDPAVISITVQTEPATNPKSVQLNSNSRIILTYTAGGTLDPQYTMARISYPDDDVSGDYVAALIPINNIFRTWTINKGSGIAVGTNPHPYYLTAYTYFYWIQTDATKQDQFGDVEPQVKTFPLENIDSMRLTLMQHPPGTPYLVTNSNLPPYNFALMGGTHPTVGTIFSKNFSQEGLALKTYNSDLFNNWLATDWIEGPDSISAVTAVDTTGNSFTIDELNLAKKVYDMLNRIAISGGTYYDWLDAVYEHDRPNTLENPIYLGGLIKNLVFQEVVSNSATTDQPLGSLAGRGRLGSKEKGGHVVAKISEPGFIMGIISLTPNIDYSQGNKWDTNLKTMDDLHKPAMDQIGFQDLVTDQMAWWDTSVTSGVPTFKKAGKQPAWINYMTNVSVVRGNFADETQQMYMTLNRRYTMNAVTGKPAIADLTTYIDPVKYNHIFADTRRDAQNFWAQIAVNMTARRKMSAKVIPNL